LARESRRPARGVVENIAATIDVNNSISTEGSSRRLRG
jgi:hypothetical protein